MTEVNQTEQGVASFSIDHTKLKKGFYISSIDQDIVTYDIRMIVPNNYVFLDNDAIHSFEHLFAHYVRSTKYSKNIVYVGPMGCRTGFYFLTRGIDHQTVLDLFRETLEHINQFSGHIPAVSPQECGNYKEHNLLGAILIAQDMAKVLANWTVEDMAYSK